MKITIDTQHDTYEDIRKVLHILTGILEQKGSIVENSAPVDTANLMGMFDSGTNENNANTLPSPKELPSLKGIPPERPKIELY